MKSQESEISPVFTTNPRNSVKTTKMAMPLGRKTSIVPRRSTDFKYKFIQIMLLPLKRYSKRLTDFYICSESLFIAYTYVSAHFNQQKPTVLNEKQSQIIFLCPSYSGEQQIS